MDSFVHQVIRSNKIDTNHQCPKCSNPMEHGLILDGNVISYLPSYWVPGDWTEPKVDLNLERYMARLGEVFSRLAERKSRKSIGIRVDTFRCKECGFLESYARDESASGQD